MDRCMHSRTWVSTLLLPLALAGCAVPSLGIRLGPVASRATDATHVTVIDQRPESRKHPWRDPRFGRQANLSYIGDHDTLPDRMSVLQSALDASPAFTMRFRQVQVQDFDILWNTGATTGLDLQVDVGPEGPNVGLGSQSGNNHFTCTLRASVDGRSYERVTRGEYFATQTQMASNPVIGAAARHCLDSVIAQWMDGALSGKDPVRF